jgi:aspartokinase/homoserine dehydrogenase 1
MKVLKFGGTSVGSVKYINNVISILKSNAIDKSVVVVSAIGGITDKRYPRKTANHTWSKHYCA